MFEQEIFKFLIDQAPMVVGFLGGLYVCRKWHDETYKKMVEIYLNQIDIRMQEISNSIKDLQKETTILTKTIAHMEGQLKTKDFRSGAI